ncbi:MAG: hypothetical protein GY737_18690, partial [Desulfobacteraceae bacterium]|nr:hypothetical protein [Desulfobacteraceae bacterium]
MSLDISPPTQFQKEKALELVQRAGISATGPHDMSDGAKIQEVIGPDFQLRVWSLRHGRGKVYQGPPGFKWTVNIIIDEKRG